MAAFNALVFIQDGLDVDTVIRSVQSTLEIDSKDQYQAYNINSDSLNKEEILSLTVHPDTCSEDPLKKIINLFDFKELPLLAFIDIDIGWYKQGEMKWYNKVEYNNKQPFFLSELENFIKELELEGIDPEAYLVTFIV